MRFLRLLSPVKPVIALSLLTVLPLLAQDSRQLEYAVLLDQPAVAAKFRGAERAGFAAQSLRLHVRAQQAQVKSRLRGLGFPVTGSVLECTFCPVFGSVTLSGSTLNSRPRSSRTRCANGAVTIGLVTAPRVASLTIPAGSTVLRSAS